jgi:hypothetical protein
MTMIVAGLQPRTTYEAGRIRAGDKDEKGRPQRLDGFRLTTRSESAAIQCAELYDGFPQGQGDECQLAPNWPMCWGDWILAVVRAGDEEQFAKLTGPDAMPLADLCLRVLLAAAAGTEAGTAS